MKRNLVQRTKRILGSNAMAVGASAGLIAGAMFWANHAVAAPIELSSSAALLESVPAADFESFEGLSTDRRTNQHSTLTLGDLTVSASAKRMSVYSRSGSGQTAVTGKNYVKYSRESGGSMATFDFTSPMDTFGVSVIDWGERGQGTLNLLAEGFGIVQTVQTPQADGDVIFMGVQLPSAVNSFQLTHDLSSESWAFDDVYFGQNGALQHAVSTPQSQATDVTEPAWLSLIAVGLLALGRLSKRGAQRRTV